MRGRISSSNSQTVGIAAPGWLLPSRYAVARGGSAGASPPGPPGAGRHVDARATYIEEGEPNARPDDLREFIAPLLQHVGRLGEPGRQRQILGVQALSALRREAVERSARIDGQA